MTLATTVICNGCGGMLGRTEEEYDRIFNYDCGHDPEQCDRECTGSIDSSGWCKGLLCCQCIVEIIYSG